MTTRLWKPTTLFLFSSLFLAGCETAPPPEPTTTATPTESATATTQVTTKTVETTTSTTVTPTPIKPIVKDVKEASKKPVVTAKTPVKPVTPAPKTTQKPASKVPTAKAASNLKADELKKKKLTPEEVEELILKLSVCRPT